MKITINDFELRDMKSMTSKLQVIAYLYIKKLSQQNELKGRLNIKENLKLLAEDMGVSTGMLKSVLDSLILDGHLTKMESSKSYKLEDGEYIIGKL